MEGKVDDPKAYCGALMRRTEARCKQGIEDMENIGLLEAAIRLRDLEALKAKASPVLFDASGYAEKFDPAKPMTFIANEETPNRYGDIIVATGWQLDNFRRNPVLMFSHDHSLPPVGLVHSIEVRGKQLVATVRWDDGDPFAAAIKGKYERGFMRAVSVGFQPLEYHELDGPTGQKPISFDKAELLELSVVAVPAHPSALRQAMGDRRFQLVIPQVIPLEQEKGSLSAFEFQTIQAAITKLKER